jgi:hypothetical protein
LRVPVVGRLLTVSPLTVPQAGEHAAPPEVSVQVTVGAVAELLTSPENASVPDSRTGKGWLAVLVGLTLTLGPTTVMVCDPDVPVKKMGIFSVVSVP